jgi:hypothetical protein
MKDYTSLSDVCRLYIYDKTGLVLLANSTSPQRSSGSNIQLIAVYSGNLSFDNICLYNGTEYTQEIRGECGFTDDNPVIPDEFNYYRFFDGVINGVRYTPTGQNISSGKYNLTAGNYSSSTLGSQFYYYDLIHQNINVTISSYAESLINEHKKNLSLESNYSVTVVINASNMNLANDYLFARFLQVSDTTDSFFMGFQCWDMGVSCIGDRVNWNFDGWDSGINITRGIHTISFYVNSTGDGIEYFADGIYLGRKAKSLKFGKVSMEFYDGEIGSNLNYFATKEIKVYDGKIDLFSYSVNITNALNSNLVNPIYLNFSVNNSFPTNVSLYINNSYYNSVIVQAGNNIVAFPIYGVDGYYSYYATAEDFNYFGETSEQYFYLARSPNITTNLDGSIKNFSNELYLEVNISNIYLKNLTVVTSCAVGYSNSSVSIPFNFSMYNSTLGCGIGFIGLNVTACTLVNSTYSQCSTSALAWYNLARLNITAHNFFGGAVISNFSAYVRGAYYGKTINGRISIDNLVNGIYQIIIVPDNFATISKNITIASDYTSYDFQIMGSNSIYSEIKDELTGMSINENVSIVYTSSSDEFTRYTTNGTFYIDNMSATSWLISFQSEHYFARTYTVTVGENTSQYLTAYLTNSSLFTKITVKDITSGDILSDVGISMYRFINGTWAVVESKYTDITGKAQFFYILGGNYKFYVSKSGYNDYIFYLNPILFGTYDVSMQKSSLIDYEVDFDKLAIISAPDYFENNVNTTLNFIISSPNGTLIQYGINVSYPYYNTTLSYSQDGFNALGGQLSVPIYLAGALMTDTVRLDYYYISTLGGRRNFTKLLSISDMSYSNNTFVANRTRTFGLTIIERVLIITLIVAFFCGLIALFGHPLGSGILAILIYAYSVYIGFVPIWIVLPSCFIGFFALMWSSR